MTKFIFNNSLSDHNSALNSLFKGATHLDWLVAFSSLSGLTEIKVNFTDFLVNGKTARVIVGLNYYHTQPEVLDYFYDLACRYPKTFEFYIGNANSKLTFHPKAYVFRYTNKAKESRVKIIIGSANLTGGGLYNNYEFSAQLQFKIDENAEDGFLVNFENHVKEMIANKDVVLANTDLIDNYRREHDFYTLHKALAEKRAKISIKKSKDDSYEYFRVVLEDYQKVSPDERNFNNQVSRRLNHRGLAIKKLNEFVANPPVSSGDFLREYKKFVTHIPAESETPYWHSGMLHMLPHKVAMNYGNFIAGINDIERKLNSSLNPEDAYDILKYHFSVNRAKKYSGVCGAGPNVITEILHTYDNKKYPIMNKLSIAGLRKVSRSNYPVSLAKTFVKGKDYQVFYIEAEKLCKALSLNNFTEFDALMNYDYW